MLLNGCVRALSGETHTESRVATLVGRTGDLVLRFEVENTRFLCFRSAAHILGALLNGAAARQLTAMIATNFSAGSCAVGSGTTYASPIAITPLGFRLTKASGPREALPPPSRRSHGGIKARET